MKIVDARKAVVLGGVLAVTLAAGCFGGGRGYSNQPYSNNGGYYSSNTYDGGYGNPYPYNRGYNDTHAYPQSFGNSNSYSAGLPYGVRTETSRDDHQDRSKDQHVAVTRDPVQAPTEKRPSTIDRDDYSRRDSQSAHSIAKN